MNKDDGQTMDTCGYGNQAQTAVINVARVSVIPGYTFDYLKSQMQRQGKLTDVSGLGSAAFETEMKPAESGGFTNSCGLVVNVGGTAILQISASSQSAPYSSLCSQAEAVAHLLMR